MEPLTEFCTDPKHEDTCEHDLYRALAASLPHLSGCFLAKPDVTNDLEEWEKLNALLELHGVQRHCAPYCASYRREAAEVIRDFPNARFMPVMVATTPSTGVELLPLPAAPDPNRIGRPGPVTSRREIDLAARLSVSVP